MQSVIFSIEMHTDLEKAWQQLEERGCQILYSNEEEHVQQLVGYLPKGTQITELMAEFEFITGSTPINLSPQAIDWEAQWATHGLGYRDGYLHLNIQDYATAQVSEIKAGVLRLKPGPGFGDLSHPTTRVVLQLMDGRMTDQNILDVGCGSGVLSVVALAMGAKEVLGIDIDPEAILHAQENAILNGMQEHICFAVPEECDKYFSKVCPITILMNMIQSEQDVAWKSLGMIQKQVKVIITSGVLAEERLDYLKKCENLGWKLIQEKNEDGWLGFVFNMNS